MKLLIIILLCCGFFYGYVRYLESVSVFYPEKDLTLTPKDVGLSFVDVNFPSANGDVLHGWFCPHDNATTTLIYAHGNAGNISDRVEKIKVLQAMGVNVFIFDYRGYGRSEGRPTEKGLYQDIVAAYDYLKENHARQSKRVVAYGASLGGPVAVHLAQQRQVDGLIIDSSFPQGIDMAKLIYPFIPSFMVSIKLDSRSIAQMTMPKLFLHSEDDTVVPYILGKRLFDLAAEPKRFVTLRGDHVDGHSEDLRVFEEGIGEFIKKIN